MRTSILVFSLVALAACPVLGSVVVYDGSPGIIAYGNGGVLDSDGHVWQTWDDQWVRDELGDPPVPIENIKFWDLWAVVTTTNELWNYHPADHTWVYLGLWPGAPASVENGAASSPSNRASPNPSSGACRIAFSLDAGGSVRVEVVDVSGRVVRNLLDGPNPAGDYRLLWDGRDDNGREVAAGVYLTRIETAEGVTSGRMTLAR